jgi:TPR repeat protein
MRAFLLALTALMLFATTPVAAGDMKDAEVAVFRLWKPLADQGDTHPQALIGMMYYRGAGVPKDYAKAVYWWTKAAKKGHADAQYTLGLMYRDGKTGACEGAVLLWCDVLPGHGRPRRLCARVCVG